MDESIEWNTPERVAAFYATPPDADGRRLPLIDDANTHARLCHALARRLLTSLEFRNAVNDPDYWRDNTFVWVIARDELVQDGRAINIKDALAAFNELRITPYTFALRDPSKYCKAKDLTAAELRRQPEVVDVTFR
jgi:hypothetical protein